MIKSTFTQYFLWTFNYRFHLHFYLFPLQVLSCHFRLHFTSKDVEQMYPEIALQQPQSVGRKRERESERNDWIMLKVFRNRISITCFSIAKLGACWQVGEHIKVDGDCLIFFRHWVHKTERKTAEKLYRGSCRR